MREKGFTSSLTLLKAARGAVSSPREARPILPHFTSPSSHREVASPTVQPPLPGEPRLVLQGPRCKNINRTAAAETVTASVHAHNAIPEHYAY